MVLKQQFQRKAKMNNKVKAVLITVAAAAWCGTVAIGLQTLSKFVTPEQISVGLIVVGLSLCFYTLYSLILTKLEFDDTISDMVDRK